MKLTRRIEVALEWKLQDFWIGVFWRKSKYVYDIWISLVPCLPLHIMWFRYEY